MAQKGRLLVCGDAGEALGDSIYEARLYVRRRGRRASARTASRRRCATSTRPRSSTLLERGRASTTSIPRRLPPLRIGARALQLQGRRRRRVLRWPCASRRSSAARSSPRSSAPRARASTTSAASARSAASPTSTTSCCWARACRATRSRAIASAATRTSCSATRHAKRPLELDIPITIAGMSFGALSAPAKEALGRGASAMGTSTTTGDGGMTPEERAASKTLVYQLLPSRYGMNPDDLRRADAIEIVIGQGAKPGGGGILLGQKISDRVAEMRDLPAGHRPAQRLPSPRLDRPRRPPDQDRGAARDHRLGEADLHQDRRVAHLLRRRARGQGGRRRHRARRHAGRDRGDAGRLHRARRDPDAAGGAPRRGRAPGARDAPPHPARRLRRDPLGRRRRQGACARGRRRLDRGGGAHRPGRQLARLRLGVRAHRHRARLLRRLAGGP